MMRKERFPGENDLIEEIGNRVLLTPLKAEEVPALLDDVKAWVQEWQKENSAEVTEITDK